MQILGGRLQNPGSYPSRPLPSQQAGPSLAAGAESARAQCWGRGGCSLTSYTQPTSFPPLGPKSFQLRDLPSTPPVLPAFLTASVSEITPHGDSAPYCFTSRAMMGRIQKVPLHSNIHFPDSLVFFLIPEKGIKLERTASLFVCVVFCLVWFCHSCTQKSAGLWNNK